MKIIIEKYSPEWKVKFETEKNLLEKALDLRGVIIEHIGSTAVEGLDAKPVIDIMIGLPDFSIANVQIKKIEKLRYDYISEYESIMPYRKYFRKETEGVRTHHIHMVQTGTEFWKRHLFFCDHLRNNKEDREAYCKLKKELVQREWNDRNDYADAKTEFIRGIERKVNSL